MKKILFGLLAACLLSACGDDHPGQHCVHTHQETVMVNGVCLMYINAGTASAPVQVCTLYQQIPVTEDVCDTWVKDAPPSESKSN